MTALLTTLIMFLGVMILSAYLFEWWFGSVMLFVFISFICFFCYMLIKQIKSFKQAEIGLHQKIIELKRLKEHAEDRAEKSDEHRTERVDEMVAVGRKLEHDLDTRTDFVNKLLGAFIALLSENANMFYQTKTFSGRLDDKHQRNEWLRDLRYKHLQKALDLLSECEEELGSGYEGDLLRRFLSELESPAVIKDLVEQGLREGKFLNADCSFGKRLVAWVFQETGTNEESNEIDVAQAVTP